MNSPQQSTSLWFQARVVEFKTSETNVQGRVHAPVLVAGAAAVVAHSQALAEDLPDALLG